MTSSDSLIEDDTDRARLELLPRDQLVFSGVRFAPASTTSYPKAESARHPPSYCPDQIVSLFSTISTSTTNVIKMPAILVLELLTSHLKGFRRNLKKLTNI